MISGVPLFLETSISSFPIPNIQNYIQLAFNSTSLAYQSLPINPNFVPAGMQSLS